MMFKKIVNKSQGFIHGQLLAIAAITVIGVGAVGGYVVYKSGAAADYNDGCWVGYAPNPVKYPYPGGDKNKPYLGFEYLSSVKVNYLLTMWGDGSESRVSQPLHKFAKHFYPDVSTNTKRSVKLIGYCKDSNGNTIKSKVVSFTFTQTPKK